jgi:diguanylate cyclase (GGDEF)-like protein
MDKPKSSSDTHNPNSNQSDRLHLSWSLGWLLIVLFVLPVVSAVGLVGYLSFRNGQQAVNEMAFKLQNEMSGRINQHLDSYLTSARQLNELNATAIISGPLDPQDLDSVGRFFWKQAKLYNVGYILFGTKTGEYVDVGRPHTFDLELITERIEPKQYKDKRLYIYEPDGEGNRGKQIAITENYPFQKEAWYAEVARSKKSLWTSVYSWESPSTNPLAIAISSPVYDRQKNFIGAVAIEQRLSQISDFLRQLKVTSFTTIFIIERNGLIVANSSLSEPFKVTKDKPERIKALDSKDIFIQATTRYLTQSFGSFSNIRKTQQFCFLFQRQEYYGQITPWQDELGLDWLVVTLIPESDFMKQIDANTRRTLLLCFLASIAAVAIAVVTARQIARPIWQLNACAREIASGNLDRTIDIRGIKELELLGNSFNWMVRQLQQSFNDLAAQNAELIDLNKRKKELEYLAEVDSLTQIANRRCFDERLQWEWQRSARQKQPLALILFDVDYFKRYNDCYGHQAGDECLKKIAGVAKQTVNRTGDLVCRYGGEEFAVILPDTDLQGATVIAERIRQAVRQLEITHQQSEIGEIVTISLGIASLIPKPNSEVEKIINLADRALYRAKQEGRDRTA